MFNSLKRWLSGNENSQRDTEQIEIKIADSMTLNIRGIPQDLDQNSRYRIAESITRVAIQSANNSEFQPKETINSGETVFKWEEKSYQLTYSLKATALIQTMQLYKESLEQIIKGVRTGKYDSKLAHTAVQYIHRVTQEEAERIAGMGTDKRVEKELGSRQLHNPDGLKPPDND